MSTPDPAGLTTGFQTLLAGGAVGTGPGNVQSLHGYWTNNTKAEVETAGYFNNVYAAYEGAIKEGDGLIVFGDIDGTPWTAVYTFSVVVDTSTDVELTEASLGVASTGTEIDAVCDQSARGCIEKVAQVSLGATELGGTETDTSFSFPANGAIFLDAWLNVTDSESGTVDVGTQGTSNDPDGILDGVSLAATGYVGQTSNVGALRGKFIPGSDPVSVTSSGDLDSCEATLYIRYLELVAAS